MLLSVIIPVYNEAATIEEVLRRVRATARPDLQLEIIIVDDASTDGTAEILKRQAGAGRLLTQPRNLGKGAAVRAGLASATGDAVVVQDADLEYDPADLLALLEPIRSGGARVVYGSRILGRNPHSYLRYYYGGRFLTVLFNVLYGARLTDLTTCYKVFRRETLTALPLNCARFEFCAEVTARLARRRIPIVEVPISYRPRSLSEGKKIRWHDGVVAIWTLVKLRFSAADL
ncbi:MAG TPA: glycosyltransferase family 2 protein [Candidatus Polarisedimenticolia bacterium]|nr:glycosyltransferase family 2 protein [Candidatus Polarisedimenticolia bacterium]